MIVETLRSTVMPPGVAAGPEIPWMGGADSTAALLGDGYVYGLRRFRRVETDVFRTRVMGRNALVGFGSEFAEAFYEPGRTTRRWALPVTALTLLLDRGSVSLLDGAGHARRKEMFMGFMTPASIGELRTALTAELEARVGDWAQQESVVLMDELHSALCAAVCRWSGITSGPGELRERTRELTAMVAGAGGVGPRNLRGQWLRRRTERWAASLVEGVRDGTVDVDPDRPLAVIARHTQLDGRLLQPAVAAVELINVLRPTVAVARFITFAALALHRHPEVAGRVATDDDQLRWCVQEVRRTAPFFPVVGGRVIQPFSWRGHHVPAGSWLLLDVYATNHDPRLWTDPFAFRPERFRDADVDAVDLIPQGGGDFNLGHRCAGEWLTIGLMEEAVRWLTTAVRYRVPAQDLDVDRTRMPARPASGFVISDVSAVSDVD